MTIIQVMHSHTGGGVERHVVDLSRALAARGHRVLLACPNRGWLWDAVQGSQVTPVHLAMDGLLDLTSVSRLTRLVHRTGADMLHAHMTRGSFYAAKAGRRTLVPVVASAHAAHTFKHYEGADRVLCASEAVRRNLLRHGIPESRLRVVYHGVRSGPCAADPATVARLRRSCHVPEGGAVVGTIGRLTPDAGIATLIEVAARWKTERPEVRFLVAGQGDEDVEKELHRAVEAADLGRTFTFLSHSEEACSVMAALDALAAPSRREPSPRILLEAFAAGRPVVAAATGSAPEIIRDGVTGFLVHPDDPDALEAALARALDGPGPAAIVEAAREETRERFSLDRMVDEIEACYREAAGRPCR